MGGGAGELVINLDLGAGSDAEGLARATYHLRRELAQLDVDDVTIPRSDQAPERARGLDLGAVGTLLVTLGQDAALGALLDALRDWVSRDRHRRVRIELDGDVLEVYGVSTRDQRRLIDHWLHRHRGR
jgi:hypothetical protein